MLFFSLFGIMPHFYQYYLCILKLGYLNGAGVLGLGGHITFHISTFSHDCVFRWFWAHKKVHADKQSHAEVPIISSFLFSFNNIMGPKLPQSMKLVRSWWCGEELCPEVELGKTQSETSLTRWVTSCQPSLQGSNGWSMRSGLSKMSAICSGVFQNRAPHFQIGGSQFLPTSLEEVPLVLVEWCSCKSVTRMSVCGDLSVAEEEVTVSVLICVSICQ